MERVGRSLSQLSGDIQTAELARSAWPAAVGKRIAAHATAILLVRDKLVVEVDDAIWQKQLWHLRDQIIRNLGNVLGSGIVNDLEFRIAVQRRPPETALRANSQSTVADDADRIEDNILRFVYKQSRKKASA